LWTNWRCSSRLVRPSALRSSPWLPRWIVPRLLVWGWNAARCLIRGEVRTCAKWNCCQSWPGTHQESRCHTLPQIQFGIAGHRLIARTGEAAIDAGLQGTTSCISASWAMIQWQRGMFQGHRNTPCNRRSSCATLANSLTRHPSPHLSQLSTWPGGGTLLKPFRSWSIHGMRGTAPWS
jgi:hypothetical protein